MPALSSVENWYDPRRALKVEFICSNVKMPTLQSPVEEKVNEYETYLNGFLSHVVVEQKTGVPEQKRL